MHGKPPSNLQESKFFFFFWKKVCVFRAVLGFLFGQIAKMESGNPHLL